MAGPFSSKEWELFVQAEATYGVSPGALAGTDAFKARAGNPWSRVIARYDRDKDSGNQASVLSTQIGKQHTTWQIAADVIPSGNTTTPTQPDMGVFYEKHFGAVPLIGLGHTTVTTGSTTTVLQLVPGGVAAAGLVPKMFVGVNVSLAYGIEVRQIPVGGITGEAVTLDRPLSAAPISGRAVVSSVTYLFDSTVLGSVHLWGYLQGDNFRHSTGGNSVRNLDLSIDFSSDTPVAEQTFSGEGKAITTHSTARPTAVTSGEPLIPTEGKVWIGNSAVLCVVKAGIQSDNALELRQNESCTLEPSGLKRTGNGGNFNVTQTLDMLLTSGAVEGIYDNAGALTAYDVMVQLGVTQGKTVAWRTPKFIPDVVAGDQDGEVSLQMSGRAYALTSPSTELALAFL